MPRLDRRTVSAKRYYDLVRQFSDELGGGNLSAMDAGLIRQAAAITLRAEQLQAQIIDPTPGVQVDGDEIVRLSSECRRLLTTLRAKAAKNKPNGAAALQDFLARKAAQAAPEAATDT